MLLEVVVPMHRSPPRFCVGAQVGRASNIACCLSEVSRKIPALGVAYCLIRVSRRIPTLAKRR